MTHNACCLLVSFHQSGALSLPIDLQLFIESEQPSSDSGSVAIQVVAFCQDAHKAVGIISQQPVIKDDWKARVKVIQLPAEEAVRGACVGRHLPSSSTDIVEVLCSQTGLVTYCALCATIVMQAAMDRICTALEPSDSQEGCEDQAVDM